MKNKRTIWVLLLVFFACILGVLWLISQISSGLIGQPTTSSTSSDTGVAQSDTAELNITSDITSYNLNANGSVDVCYRYTIINTGTLTAINLIAHSWFTPSSAGLFNITKFDSPTGLLLNSGFDGIGDIDLFAPGNTIAPGVTHTINLCINIPNYDFDLDLINHANILGDNQAASSSGSSVSTSRSTTITTSRPTTSRSTTSRPIGTISSSTSSAADPVTISALPSSSSTQSSGDNKLYDATQIGFKFPKTYIPPYEAPAGKG